MRRGKNVLWLALYHSLQRKGGTERGRERKEGRKGGKKRWRGTKKDSNSLPWPTISATCDSDIIISSTPFSPKCVLVWMINYVVTLSGSWLCMFPALPLSPGSSLLTPAHAPCSSQAEPFLEGAKLSPISWPLYLSYPPGTLFPTPSCLVLLSSEVTFQCSFFRSIFLCLSTMNHNYIIQMLLFFFIARIINLMTCLFVYYLFLPLDFKQRTLHLQNLTEALAQ